jgi:hypothetical protein
MKYIPLILLLIFTISNCHAESISDNDRHWQPVATNGEFVTYKMIILEGSLYMTIAIVGLDRSPSVAMVFVPKEEPCQKT